ncbi:MAG: GNAT family N-acetyltransferase [Candidatus Thorarchaeota archaeon]
MTNDDVLSGALVVIQAYSEAHADSIARNLFQEVNTDTVIQQRRDLLAPGPEEVYSVCGVCEGEVVGICTGVRKQWAGERHRIEMVQVVVRKDFRGRGIAKNMMRDIAAHFRPHGIEFIQISVEASNEDGFRAYQRIGFQRFGVFRNGLKFGDDYSDEILLSMHISDLLEP